MAGQSETGAVKNFRFFDNRQKYWAADRCAIIKSIGNHSAGDDRSCIAGSARHCEGH